MEAITLTHIGIENFKGLKSIDINFNHQTSITGANGTGKSSIQDAFYWCLFGTNAAGTTTFSARPYDKNSVINGDVEVKVSVTLQCGERETTFVRTLAAGKNDNSATYFVNEVPCKMSEFKAKLNGICPENDLKLLTSVAAFNALDTKAARAKLQDLVVVKSDSGIAKDFPAVSKALNDGKTIDELKRETVAKRTKSEVRLKEIPIAIDAQDKLRPIDVDFKVIKADISALEKRVKAIDAKLEKSANDTAPSDEQQDIRKAIASKHNEIIELDSSIEGEYRKRKLDIERLRNDANSEIDSFRSNIDRLNNECKIVEAERDSICDTLKSLSKQWDEINSLQFDTSIEQICPTCKKPYTNDELSQMTGTLVEQYNEHKLGQLSDIEKKAKVHKERKDTLTSRVIEISDSIKALEVKMGEHSTIANSYNTELSKLPTVEQAKASSKERVKLTADIEALSQKLIAASPNPNTNTEAVKTEREELQQQLSMLNKQLGKESLNEEIDNKKEVLQTEEKALAQAVSDCINIENQIKDFCKRKIEMVENAVASLFEIVRFKMYEPNLTNDGEKEICECVVDGVPYNNLNTAMRVNAGIDIINGISKGLQISAPIWIDNKESVTELIATDSQLITIAVVEGQQLQITSKN